MKKKSLALIAIAVLTVASIATAITLAYFTDTKTAKNTFTIGNVKIELTEPGWDQSGEIFTKAGVKAVPGFAIDKAPTIKNIGDNAAYIRAKVTINHAGLFEGKAYDILKAKGDGWNLNEARTTAEGDTITYVYEYANRVEPDKDHALPPVFEKVTLPKTFDNIKMEALADPSNKFTITVVAEAIQADGITAEGQTAAEAAFAQLNATPATPAP